VATGVVLVTIDQRYFRPAEVEDLLGDSTRARQRLGWQPTITFREMIAKMVYSDIAELSHGHTQLA
jgi:GDPmannose 4,6-dehydratase